MAAEYIVSSGNPNVILCERGIRTFETYTRNTMDLAAVPAPQPADPPAGHRRSEPRHRQALARQAAGHRRRRGRRRRRHGRGPSASRRRSVRRRAAARPRRVPRADGGHRPGPRPCSRALHGAVRVRGARQVAGADGSAPKPGCPSIERDDRSRLRDRRRARPHGGASARRAPRARRQVGQPSGADAGGPRRRREPDRGAGDGADVRSTAGIVRSARRAGGATPRRRVRRSAIGSSRPAPTASSSPTAILDCGNSGTIAPAHRRRPRGTPDDDHPRRRRVVAPPSGRSYHRAAAPDGRSAVRPPERLPSSPDRGRPYPARAIDFETPVPSAQVKSAILLAGLRADGRTTVRESVATRDHTERMLRARGVPVDAGRHAGSGVAWTVEGGAAVRAVHGASPRGRLRGRVLARRRARSIGMPS